MSDFAAPIAVPFAASWRRLAAGAACVLGLAVGGFVWGLAATHPPAIALGALVALATLALASLVETPQAAALAKVFVGVAGFLALVTAARIPADRLELVFALGALGFLGWGVWRIAATTRMRLGLSPRATLVTALGLTAALAAFSAYYVLVSQDLQMADFMFYRVVSIAVATLTRSGNLLGLVVDVAGSMKQDYSWAPAILPGLALAAFGPLSRAVYQGAIVICYTAPALFALAWLAREIAAPLGPRASRALFPAPTQRAGGTPAVPGATFAFALAAVFAAYPFGVVVAARGMPDIGGLALFVVALRIADKLARALSLRAGHDARVRSSVQKLGFTLAVTLFSMFLFRRWYAFAAVSVIAALAVEILATALRRGKTFRWREAGLAAAVGVLTLLALLTPVLVDWLPNPAAHDYTKMYAAYRKTPAVLAEVVGDWCGFGILALAIAGAALALARSGRRGRLARLAFIASPLSALLFLRVQSPYPHHLYLLAPAISVFIAAPLLMLFAKSRLAGVAALAALGALTLTPVGAWAPKGVFPTAGRARAPRTDLAELARMKDWVDARATPAHKVCGLGSSYTFSGQLIAELWQLKAEKSPLTRNKAEETSVGMSDVDTVDGPPKEAIKNCAILIVGDPVQTHVIPSYQLTVTLPSSEMLEGVGIGAHYRRTGEVFQLEHGVSAVAFEQVTPLTDDDMAALAERWRAARAEVEAKR
jgi:hypothetical protein